MEKIQSEKLRRAADGDVELGSLFRYYRDHKASYTQLSVRGIIQGTNAHGLRIGQPKAREFLSLLVSAGVGKGTKDGAGNISHISKMNLSTKEVGSMVVGDSKDTKQYKAKMEERGFARAVAEIQSSPDELKIYPMRKASNISITVTINGYPVIMPLPDDLAPDQLAALIERLKRVEDGYDPHKK